MIGRRVRVFWPIDQQWYIGLVQQYDEMSGEHMLLYPDGDTEWVSIGDSGPHSGANSTTLFGPNAQRDGVAQAHPTMRHGERFHSLERDFASHSKILADMKMGSIRQHPSVNGDSRYPPSFSTFEDAPPFQGISPYGHAPYQHLPPPPPSANDASLPPSLDSNQHSPYFRIMPTQFNGPPNHLREQLAPTSDPTRTNHAALYRNVNTQSLPFNGSTTYPHTSELMTNRAAYHRNLPINVNPTKDRESQSSQSLHGPMNYPQGPIAAFYRGPPITAIESNPSLHGSMASAHGDPSYIPMASPRELIPPKNSKIPWTAVKSNYTTVNKHGKRKMGPKAWTKHEDELLLNIVKMMGMPVKWTAVADTLPSRTGKQCRERYVNHLNPRLKNTQWHPCEDATIFSLYNNLGSKWAKMAKMIPGRTDNGIKNRFHNLRRQLESEDIHRKGLSNTVDFSEEIRLDRVRPYPQYLRGQSDELWDMTITMGSIAAHSNLATVEDPTDAEFTLRHFGPFFEPGSEGEQCFRCGLFVPSVQCGKSICKRSRWCFACTRVPANLSGNLLREVLNLRRSLDKERRPVIEGWGGS